jgi:hypothetical protein
MKQAMLEQVVELLRETFEGALPGQGTQYLDHDSGILPTLSKLTAEDASRRFEGHPSIASHVRHMSFHLRVTSEWIQGDHSRRDWKASFEPQTVTDAEWRELQKGLEVARAEVVRTLEGLSPERFVEEGAGLGSVTHLAYHLGAIRQLMHRAKGGSA